MTEILDVLADFEDPLVRSTAHSLTNTQPTFEDKIEKIFYFVRDTIKFYFPIDGDFVKASDTIQSKQGQCNTKGALFLAFCKAVGIPVRLHFSLIRKEIQKGLFTGLSYWLMPRQISHSWIEVLIDDKWYSIDSYINDDQLHKAAVQELERRGWQTGYSISKSDTAPGNEFNLSEQQFEQMGAVIGDHGVWDEPAEYYASDQYRNRPGPIRMFIYRNMVAKANSKVAVLRERCV